MSEELHYQYRVSTSEDSGDTTIVAVKLRGTEIVGVSGPIEAGAVASDPEKFEAELANYAYHERETESTTDNPEDWAVYDPRTA